MSTTLANPSAARDHARGMAGRVVEAMPVLPPVAHDLPEDVPATDLVWEETIAAGGYATRRLSRGSRLRLIDLKGDACASLLIFNAEMPTERLNVAGALSSIRRSYGFASAQILRPDGSVVLSDGRPTLTGARLQRGIDEALASGGVASIDLYRPDDAPGIRLAFVAPIAAPRRGSNLGRLLVAMELTPDDYLFSLLASWPTDEASGEAVLVRREWGDLVYLSNLRYQPDSALKVRRPLSEASLPAAKLLLGQVDELWDMVALAEYPSLAAFRQMATSPAMQAIEHHRKAGLAGQLNIRTKPGAGF